ncbi:hypothetical protein [Jeotgalibacillus proteolyticus]|uniref:Uncharacterized protein n=1 Tax=Jeotgalibacillus proteolyticus TaxID=2082395 RepID=A0A2S5GB55_9BACL|nr:hypothetical protein [Jeotgalibacillus proteolyticus]PPA70155.1 hypothetical protein C4B60_11245 [Jeotgalibacillus proteolyticus]
MKKLAVGIIMTSILFSHLPVLKKLVEASKKKKHTFIDPAQPFSPLSEKELKTIRNSKIDYAIELTHEQALIRAAEISGKSIKQLKRECRAPDKIVSLATSCSWVEKKLTLSVNSYSVPLIVIVKLCRNGSLGWINTLQKPLLLELSARDKLFSGVIEVDLVANGFCYLVNGHLYLKENVVGTGALEAASASTAAYSVSETSDYIGECYTGSKWVKLL